MRNLVLLGLLFLSGCAMYERAMTNLFPAPEMSKEELKVRILRNSDPPKECITIGDVGISNYFTSYADQRNALRKKVHKMGGNLVVIEETNKESLEGDGGIRGEAYKCQ